MVTNLKEKKDLLRRFKRMNGCGARKFYVYKLSVKESGLFYIGATMKLDHRELQHYGGIRAAMGGLLENTLVTGKIPAHLIIAKEFITSVPADYHTAKYKKPLWMTFDHIYFRSKCNFEVVAIKKTKEEAAEVEMQLLIEHKNNPQCLNIVKKSHYDKRMYNERKY